MEGVTEGGFIQDVGKGTTNHTEIIFLEIVKNSISLLKQDTWKWFPKLHMGLKIIGRIGLTEKDLIGLGNSWELSSKMRQINGKRGRSVGRLGCGRGGVTECMDLYPDLRKQIT